MPDRFRPHLARALDTLQAEVPSLASRLGRAVGERVIEIEVDGAPFWVAVEAGRVRVRDDGAGCVAWGRASGETIDGLLAGRASIEDAVMDGSVELRGGLDDLVALDEALRVFIQCAVRAPGILPILASWRARRGGES